MKDNLSGNIGEWSEFYAFCFLAGQGIVYCANEAAEKTGEFLPIKGFRRIGSGGEAIAYLCAHDVIRVMDADNQVCLAEIPQKEFAKQAAYLYHAICANKQQRTFVVPLTEEFMSKIYASSLKAPSDSKSDLIMSVSDIHTGIVTTVGWSIKSELGASPTLLNASKSTNFTYEIMGLDARYIDEINSINSQTKIIDRIRAIRDRGAMLEFHSLSNKNFASNLTVIDSTFPRVLADALLHYYEGNSGLLSDAVSVLTDRNHYQMLNEKWYEIKFKDFLVAVALGMKPATLWEGKDEANGGYLVVRKDGDVVAYHIYNRDDFKNYLLSSTKFDRASTSKHNFASIYTREERAFINLNLQIRFI